MLLLQHLLQLRFESDKNEYITGDNYDILQRGHSSQRIYRYKFHIYTHVRMHTYVYPHIWRGKNNNKHTRNEWMDDGTYSFQFPFFQSTSFGLSIHTYV